MTKPTKWLALVVIIVTALSAGPVAAQAPAGKPLRLGATYPMTGPGSQYGTYSKQGTDLAVAEINAKGGIKGSALEVILEDHQANPQVGVSAYRKLVTVDQVPLVLTLFVNVGFAQVTVADQTKTVFFTPGIVHPGITQKSQWVFRTAISAKEEAVIMAELATKRLNLKRVAVMAMQNETGVLGTEAFTQITEKLGGKVAAVQTYPIGGTDFRAQLTRLKGANPDGLYQIGRADEMGLILKQAAELGLQVQHLANVGIEVPQTLQTAGAAAEGLIYTSGAIDPKAGAQFVEMFRKRYGTDPEIWSALFYEAVHLIARAIETDGYSAEGIRNGLLKIRDFPSPTGRVTILPSREAQRDLIFKTIRNGKFVPYTP
jgi:branched-chain amino acid transport system substrate-binding protein